MGFLSGPTVHAFEATVQILPSRPNFMIFFNDLRDITPASLFG